MFRSDAKQLAEAISETQSVDAKPEPKRGSLATGVLQAMEAIEFISSRRLPFTARDLADAMEVSDAIARRILLTLDTGGWVAEDGGKPSPLYVPNGANPTKHFRALMRIRRI
jgi:predicted ArsR family transcriptional regulator